MADEEVGQLTQALSQFKASFESRLKESEDKLKASFESRLKELEDKLKRSEEGRQRALDHKNTLVQQLKAASTQSKLSFESIQSVLVRIDARCFHSCGAC
jgi:RNA polymerase-binding transcription factor DksA